MHPQKKKNFISIPEEQLKKTLSQASWLEIPKENQTHHNHDKFCS
jgi:hypothetical protein